MKKIIHYEFKPWMSEVLFPQDGIAIFQVHAHVVHKDNVVVGGNTNVMDTGKRVVFESSDEIEVIFEYNTFVEDSLKKSNFPRKIVGGFAAIRVDGHYFFLFSGNANGLLGGSGLTLVEVTDLELYRYSLFHLGFIFGREKDELYVEKTLMEVLDGGYRLEKVIPLVHVVGRTLKV